MSPQNSDVELNRQEHIANEISLMQYDIRLCRMIYLLCKYDIISVPFIREAYIICEADIIPTGISHVTAGNGYH